MCQYIFRENGCEIVNDMMDNAKGIQDVFSNPDKCPTMAMLDPKLNLVGSIPEGTRSGEVQEIDVMMELAGFKANYLAPTNTATSLLLTDDGKEFCSKFFFAQFLEKR